MTFFLESRWFLTARGLTPGTWPVQEVLYVWAKQITDFFDVDGFLNKFGGAVILVVESVTQKKKVEKSIYSVVLVPFLTAAHGRGGRGGGRETPRTPTRCC